MTTFTNIKAPQGKVSPDLFINVASDNTLSVKPIPVAALAAANPEIAADVEKTIADLLNSGATAADLERAAGLLFYNPTVKIGNIIPERGPRVLADGAQKERNCSRSLDQQRGKTTPRQQLSAKQVASAEKAFGLKTKPTKPRATGNRLILKANAPVRSLLTAAAQAAGGTRLQPIGFASYTEFLAGIPLDADGNAEVALIPVKGNEPVKGKNVKLIVKGGVPTVR